MSSIPERLLEQNNIELLSPYTRGHDRHDMRCLTCLHEWKATPLAKMQTFKKYGQSGCPKCDGDRRRDRCTVSRDANMKWFEDNNMHVLSEGYIGERVFKGGMKITVFNADCDHTFSSLPANILAHKMMCAVCGTQERMEKLYEANQAIIAERDLNAPEWHLYKRTVRSLTESIFKEHHDRINPDNRPRGLAGEADAFHLDHIVSIRACYDHGVPVEFCAHPDNLRMIPWQHNVMKQANIEYVPDALKEWVRR